MSEITNLKPMAVWKHFDNICSIPHPSKHEEKLRESLIRFAKEQKLEYLVDETGNLIIKKPASAGMENRKGVILQAHLDMVPQKNNDTKHDFENDPIQPYIDGEWVRAKGTTLGADNGIGVSAALAVLEDKTLVHPALEVLLTIDEETGMTGAFGLKPDLLKGEILMNLDSETEGELYVGCAGGIDATISLDFHTETIKNTFSTFDLSVKGLKGGHSGMDIILQRGNANKILFRILNILEELNVVCHVCEVNGGSLRNAIPREATAKIAIAGMNVAKVRSIIEEESAKICNELSITDPDLQITLLPCEQAKYAMRRAKLQKFIRLVYGLPNGVYRMSDSMPNLVETSSNLAIVKMEDNRATVSCLLRSSVDSSKEDLVNMMKAIALNASAEAEFTGGYPGWKPNMDSAILSLMKQTYKKLYNKEAKVMAIHAGLECGLLGGVYPNWDMISFGPTIQSPHSPDERVNIKSVGLFWQFLTETLKNIPVK
ncbi:MAG: aminoacyl-histidine dipeptidase [Bacteroidales bacterium]|jgi:dipeptidase D|nr:aminoacyl-histidine dipeptidase [Bacteroidales bacterium]